MISRKIIPEIRFRAFASQASNETIVLVLYLRFFISKSLIISIALFHPPELPQDNQIHLFLFIVGPSISKTCFYRVS